MNNIALQNQTGRTGRNRRAPLRMLHGAARGIAAAMIVGAASLALGLAGCESSGLGGGEDRPLVVATTTMIADLATVLGGDEVRIVGIMKPGEDPHIYEVRPRDAQHIAEADLILTNGLHLEATLAGVITNNATGHVVALAEAPGMTPLRIGSTSAAPDPHAWMDAANFKAYAAAARDALIHVDPEHADLYQSRAEAYLRELDELDAWIRGRLAEVPVDQRVIVTSHDAFNYFAQAYEVEVHGVIGISTADQPSPQDIGRLEQLIEARGVKALFIETSVSNTLNQMVRKIAAATGVVIGGTLYSDSLGEPGDDAGTYIGMMRHNTTTIAEALQ